MEAYWSFTAKSAGSTLILPDGRCDIIYQLNVHKDQLPTPIITGPATEPYSVGYNSGDQWLGIRLRPDSGARLWKQKIRTAADTVLRGNDALELQPWLAELTESPLTLSKMADKFESKTPAFNDQRLTSALDALHASGGQMRVAAIANYVGCTTRQLNRLCQSNIGLSTKTYAQLVQFHRTLNLMQNQKLSISSAAIEGGYADQAHLTRAFQRFGGFTPNNIPKDLAVPVLFA